MKTPRIQAVLVQLPGVDEVATAGVCEWAARADFKAVCQEFELKKRRGRFLLFREEKIVCSHQWDHYPTGARSPIKICSTADIGGEGRK